MSLIESINRKGLLDLINQIFEPSYIVLVLVLPVITIWLILLSWIYRQSIINIFTDSFEKFKTSTIANGLLKISILYAFSISPSIGAWLYSNTNLKIPACVTFVVLLPIMELWAMLLIWIYRQNIIAMSIDASQWLSEKFEASNILIKFMIIILLNFFLKIFMSIAWEQVAFCFSFFGYVAFRDYRKQCCAEAATHALAIFQDSLSYIQEIYDRSHLYQYLGYGPNHIPETRNEIGDRYCYDERPSRLIYNEIKKLEKELNEPIAKIGGHNAKMLLDLKTTFKQICSSLAGDIDAQLSENYTEEIRKSCLLRMPDYRKKLEQISIKINSHLDPIIQGK